MRMFALGFLWGGLASLVWVHLKQKAKTFEKYLHRELAVQEQPGRRLESLQTRVESLEEELALLQAGKKGLLPPPVPHRRPLPGSAGGVRAQDTGPVSGFRYAPSANRRRVLELLRQGCPREQILRETRLGKGAVDLILSLQEKGVL